MTERLREKLVLASGSATRRAMLAAAGVDFTVQPADLDEAALMARLKAEGAGAADVAARLAAEKALAVSRSHPARPVLGGDSVVAFGTEILSKCPDLAALRALLRRLAGRTHELVSAAALARDGVLVWQHVGRARMVMRDFSDGFLDAYLAREGAALLSSVGGYRYEGLGAQLFAAVEGDYFTVLGMPLLPVLAALRKEGVLPS